MSMPKFPCKNEILTRDEAVNSILTSIAMEETALSHIINAEGEKIQYVLANNCADVQIIMKVNESVTSLVEKIIDLQFILKMKLQITKDFLPEISPEQCDTRSANKSCPFSHNCCYCQTKKEGHII